MKSINCCVAVGEKISFQGEGLDLYVTIWVPSGPNKFFPQMTSADIFSLPPGGGIFQYIGPWWALWKK